MHTHLMPVSSATVSTVTVVGLQTGLVIEPGEVGLV